MSKGKFVAGKNGKTAVRKSADPFAVKDKPKSKSRSGGSFSAPKAPAKHSFASKVWPILAAVAGLAVIVVGVMLFHSLSKERDRQPTAPSTTALRGLTRTELEQKAHALDELLRSTDMVLTLSEEPKQGQEAEEPIVLTLTPEESGAGLDLTRLSSDLAADTKAAAADNYLVDLRNYLTVKKEVLRTLADKTAETYGSTYVASEVEEKTASADDPDSGAGDGSDKYLLITKGAMGRRIYANEIYETLQGAYETVILAENPGEAFAPAMLYAAEHPEPIDVDALLARYYRAPVDAVYDAATNSVLPGEDGYGFDAEAVKETLEQVEDGWQFKVWLRSLPPEVTAEALEASLFRDVLAEAHTKHSAVANRTTNLKLACAAINGTVILPGEIFSFNSVVGQRTEEKGYKEAIAYVNGGASKPEIGGGVCQVASSIYYATLQAELKTVERSNHMYLVSYVPYGMDAAIYWGHLDFKFENNSPYPIRIDASVSDGQVHIILVGTEWKDYTVKMSYEILETTPWATVEKEVPNDGTYSNGEVITTPYTGYRIATYRTTLDKDGNEIATEEIAVDRYSKRDKVIAVVKTVTPTQPKPTEPAPTEPKPTEPKPTEPEPTEPEPTEPEPTEPEPTESESGGGDD